jgi:calcineurin-like phosphoesterase family protein
MVYLTSDQHFGHGKIIQYGDRPFKDIQEMKHEIITRHNRVVTDSDTVIHLGDICFASNWVDVAQILKRLKGTHHLILGNHDRIHVWDYVEAGFQSVHTSWLLEDFILVHDPAIAGVLDTSHKFIHGHVHQLGLRLAPNCYNVSVEMHDYYPVSFNKIKDDW